jgi:hypothetical protein
MDWMELERNEKKFNLFGIQTHPIPLNPHGLRANRTSPGWETFLQSQFLPVFQIGISVFAAIPAAFEERCLIW